MNRTSIEAINLVLATLNLDDAYPAQRELLREALEAAKKSQEQIATLTAMCETLNKLQETAVEMIKPAMEAAVLKEREACARACDKLGDEYADANAADCAFAIRERGAPALERMNKAAENNGEPL